MEVDGLNAENVDIVMHVKEYMENDEIEVINVIKYYISKYK